MSQPSAYPPEASFRPASGWQFEASGHQAAPRPSPAGIPTIAIALAALGLVLHGAQGIATVAPLVDLDAAVVARVLAIWSPTVALIALGLATAARSLVMTAIMTVATLAVAVLVVVFAGAGTIAWWETLAIIPLILGLAGGALSWMGLAADRTALASAGWIVVLTAVTLHAALVVVGPIVSGAIADIGSYLVNAAPVQVLGIAAIVAVSVSHGARAAAIGAGAILALLAFGLLVGPVLVAAASVEPNVGVLVVTAIRFLLVAAAGVLVILHAARR